MSRVPFTIPHNQYAVELCIAVKNATGMRFLSHMFYNGNEMGMSIKYFPGMVVKQDISVVEIKSTTEKCGYCKLFPLFI